MQLEEFVTYILQVESQLFTQSLLSPLMLAKKLQMRTSIGTIGTMLSRREFAQRALPYLDEALFSLHGPSAEIHDSLTRRKGSFERVTGGNSVVS